jgi:hypothetical protein
MYEMIASFELALSTFPLIKPKLEYEGASFELALPGGPKMDRM